MKRIKLSFDDKITHFLAQAQPVGIDRIKPELIPVGCNAHLLDAINYCIQVLNGRCLIVATIGKTLIGCVLGKFFGPNCLFIVPASRINEWANENKRYLDETFKKIRRIKASGKFQEKTVVTPDIVKNSPLILEHPWDCVVIDDCQMLQRETDRSDALIDFIKKVPSVILLSDTPIVESKSVELFNYLTLLHPIVFDSKEDYKKRYSGLGVSYDMKDKLPDPKLRELHKIFNKVSLNVAPDTPVKPVKRAYLELAPTPAQRTELGRLKEEGKKLQEQVNQGKGKIRSLQYKHQEVTWKTNGIFKSQLCHGILNQILKLHPGENIVIFAYHQEVIDAVYDFLKEAPGISILSIKTRILPLGVTVLVFLENDSRAPEEITAAERRAQGPKDINSYCIILANSTDEKIRHKFIKWQHQ